MTKPYFRQVPNFDYVNRDSNDTTLNDYVTVKNLFKRAKIRDDIFENVQYFNKYTIVGDERPDYVAYKLYDDPTLDWVILLSNNILNVQDEWPKTQQVLDRFLLDKYVSYENLNAVKHYETIEVKNSKDIVIVPAGLIVEQDFSVEYFDGGTQLRSQITVPVTNYQYEIRLEDEKRTIYALKPKYLDLVFNDLQSIMQYKKGSEQYVSKTLKKGEDINLFI